MNNKVSGIVLALAVAGLASGCAQDEDAPDVQDDVETALSQAGYEDVSVEQDQGRGIVTLSGEVDTEQDRQRAEQAARAAAGSMIVANEIGVRPEGMEGQAEDVATAQDDAIESNFEAMLASRQVEDDVDFESNNGVLRLSGEVDDPNLRNELEEMAASVPNVRQVVNEIEVAERQASVDDGDELP
jgi:hyperosmotically inducible periplasmic protein